MTKPRLNRYDRQHRRNMAAVQRAIQAIYDAAIQEAVSIAGIGGLAQSLAPDKPFTFADHPITHERVRLLFERMARDMNLTVVNGVRSAWTLANDKNNELCNRVFGDAAKSLPTEAARRYYTNNDTALEAFINRKTAGLNLSDRVWQYTDAYKAEIEAGLDYGIRTGCDARTMARDLKTYLRQPDKLFRRVRDQWGQLQLSKAAAAYHPGRGVYRSSYKNALRLTATETNMAYRTADHERWQQLDFVVGQEVHTSDTNHPVPDICDTLAGRYPKDFKFTGWHPFCRCYVIPILKTDDEINEATARILRGEDPLPHSINTVTDVPEGFREWIKDNAERTASARALPYFIAHNPKFIQLNLDNTSAFKTGAHKTGRATDREFAKLLSNDKIDVAASLSKTIMDDANQFCKEIGIERKDMSWSEADGKSPNKDGHYDNCQSAVVVYEARRRGINLVSLGHSDDDKESISYQLGENGGIAFVDKNGKSVTPQTLPVKKQEMEKALKKVISQPGRYHLGMNYNAKDGHIIVAEKIANHDVVFYDPSDGTTWSLGEILEKSKSVEIMRVDNLRLNHAVLRGISKTY